ncbi:MAG TPA: hypothetical protein V6D00_11405 [Pantanalinema sp.]
MSSLPLTYLYPAALVLTLVGLVLAIRRQLLGFALVGVTAVAYALWLASLQAWHVSGPWGARYAILVVLVALGLSLETISERMRFRMGWVGQNTVWGGLIGGMIGLFVFGGAFWMLVGTLVGTVGVQFSGHRGKQTVGRALVDGLEGFFGMFGSPGLRVLFAVVVIDLFLDLARTASRLTL